MSSPLNNVSLSDLVVVNVFKGIPSPGDNNPLKVDIAPLEDGKRLVFDESALKTLNNKLTEKTMSARLDNPNTIQYIKEFVTKMIDELYKNGLILIEDVPESPEDPYEAAKKAIKRK